MTAQKFHLDLGLTRGQWQGLLHLARLGHRFRHKVGTLDRDWEPAQVAWSGLSAINHLSEALNVRFPARPNRTPQARP